MSKHPIDRRDLAALAFALAALASYAVVVQQPGLPAAASSAPVAREPATARRLAELRLAVAQRSAALDRATAELQQQAAAAGADPATTARLAMRARELALARARVATRLAGLERGPISGRADAAEVERFAVWLQGDSEATPEVAEPVGSGVWAVAGRR